MSRLHRILRKPFFGRFEVPWRWPDGVDPAGWEHVRFANPRGAQLAALFAPAEGTPRGTLVLVHPMGKAAKGFWLKQGHTDLFRGAGYNVLAIDANGFGESEATSFDYPGDILAAGLWAQARTPDLSVGLVGASFGAAWGLCSLARAGHPYRAALLEGVFPTLAEFWHHYPAAHVMLRLSQLLWPPLEGELRPERQASRVRGRPPLLLLHGQDDPYTPPAHGERILAASRTVTDAELHVLPGVEHTYAYRDARADYERLALGFLRRAVG